MSKIDITTKSITATQKVAAAIGKVLRGGEVFELVSDLGGGKTTFVKGLALGLDITELVQSPTFTISRLYKARDDLELHHFDFYRLDQPGVMAEELTESLQQPNAIVVVEWGNIVHQVLPKNRLRLHIHNAGSTTRRLIFTIPAEYEYLAEALTLYKTKSHLA